MLLSTYSDDNDFITSETNGSVRAVIILLLNAFEQSAILTVSYVICKASMESEENVQGKLVTGILKTLFNVTCIVNVGR